MLCRILSPCLCMSFSLRTAFMCHSYSVLSRWILKGLGGKSEKPVHYHHWDVLEQGPWPRSLLQIVVIMLLVKICITVRVVKASSAKRSWIKMIEQHNTSNDYPCFGFIDMFVFSRFQTRSVCGEIRRWICLNVIYLHLFSGGPVAAYTDGTQM